MQSKVHLRLLGPVEVEKDGTPVQGFESSKALALFCYVASRDHAVSRSHLADLFWEDKPESRGRANLSRVLHNLSSLLPGCLAVDRQSFQFVHSPSHTVDMLRFNELVADQSPEALAEAVALSRGEFMSTIQLKNCPEFENWLMMERERWRLKISETLLKLTIHHATRGEYQEALEYATRLLAIEPWHEEAHRQMMLMLALSGQRTAALVQYETCRRILAEELGVEPTEVTTALYRRIRDEELGAQRQTRTNTDELPFTGREQEHAWLVEQWNVARGGSLVASWIEGEAGIGKSRLVEETLHYITKQQSLVLRGVCHEFGTPLPYQCIVAALRGEISRLKSPDILSAVWVQELAQLMPEVIELRDDLEEPGQVTVDAARQRLFEAVARFLQALATQQGSLTLLLENLHWADEASLDLLHYLFHRLEGSPIWLVGTYRREEMGSQHPLMLLHRALGQSQRTAVRRLERLDSEAIISLARTMTGLETESVRPLARYLCNKSEGHPLILHHYVKALEARHVLQKREDYWTVDASGPDRVPADDQIEIPQSVLQLILDRISFLSPEARQLLDIAAVIGRVFNPALVQEVIGREKPIYQILAQCAQQNFIRPTEDGKYVFTHATLHHVIYEKLPQWQKEGLHRGLAEAIEWLDASQHNNQESVIQHYLQSGNPENAVAYLLRAADEVEPGEAIELYDRACRLIPREDLETRFGIVARRERAYGTVRDFKRQEQDLQLLESISCRLNDNRRRAETLCRRIEWAVHTSEYEKGARTAQTALNLAAKGGWSQLRLAALRYGALCRLNQGEYSLARDWGLEALQLSSEQDDRWERAVTMSVLGVVHRGCRSYDEARSYLEEAVAEWRTLGNGQQLARSLSTLSLIYSYLGDYAVALRTQKDARRLVVEMGDTQLNASTLTTLGSIYHALGRYREAIDCFSKARLCGNALRPPKFEASIALSRAHTLLEQQQFRKAEEDYRCSLSIQSEHGILVLRAETVHGLADCLLQQGRYEDARVLLSDSEELISGAPQALTSVEHLLRQAEVNIWVLGYDSARDTTRKLFEQLQTTKTIGLTRPSFWWRAARLALLSDQDAWSCWAMRRGDQLLEEQAARLLDRALRKRFRQTMQVRRHRIEPQTATA